MFGNIPVHTTDHIFTRPGSLIARGRKARKTMRRDSKALAALSVLSGDHRYPQSFVSRVRALLCVSPSLVHSDDEDIRKHHADTTLPARCLIHRAPCLGRLLLSLKPGCSLALSSRASPGDRHCLRCQVQAFVSVAAFLLWRGDRPRMSSCWTEHSWFRDSRLVLDNAFDWHSRIDHTVRAITPWKAFVPTACSLLSKAGFACVGRRWPVAYSRVVP